LGLALAREFARHGARVALCARNADELAVAEEDIRRCLGEVRTFVCDLRDAKQIAAMIDQVEANFGKIDLLVNNAGTITVGPLETMTMADFQEAMDVNFWAAVHAALAVVPRMKARGGGRIVNIGSVGGKMPVPHLAPYCASKFALVGFSGALRIELLKNDILVTTVNPGLMRTGSPRNANFKGKHRSEYAWFSVSDALPGISMGAARAARRIVSATIHGDAEVTLGLPAKLGSKSYGLLPNLHLELTALSNGLFPDVGGIYRASRLGRQSESLLTESPVRYLGHRAEQQFNQLSQ